jgi:hypothetical protein
MRRPTRDPHAKPAIQTLERLHAEPGGKILENRQQAEAEIRSWTLSRAAGWSAPVIQMPSRPGGYPDSRVSLRRQ